jgi:hypothetical protein
MGTKSDVSPVSPMVAGADIFGAPTVLVLAYDEGVSDGYGCFDAGLFSMCLCLAAQVRGWPPARAPASLPLTCCAGDPGDEKRSS